MDKSKIILSSLIISLFLVVFFAANDKVAFVYANNHTNATCYDTDGGVNPPIRGTVYVNGLNGTFKFPDNCWNTRYLTEYYCVGPQVDHRVIDCRLGYSSCYLGACIGTSTNNTNNSISSGAKMFRSPPTSEQFKQNNNTQYCILTADPNSGIGAFYSKLRASFYNVPPEVKEALIKCNQNDPGVKVGLVSGAASRLCYYPEIQIPILHRASAQGGQISCFTNVNQTPTGWGIPKVGCTETDNGRDYPNRGFTTNGTQSGQDLCQSTTLLKEYYCGNLNSVLFEQVHCPSQGFRSCEFGRCSSSPSFMKVATTTQYGGEELKSRFFLWKIFDIFKGKSTGDAVRRTSSDDSIFGWLILGVILVAGLMYFNNKGNRVNKNQSNNNKSSKRR